MPVDVSVTFVGNLIEFQKAIPLKSFSWSVDNPATIGSTTGGAGAGKARFGEVAISKQVEAQASPALFQLLTMGGHLESATFAFTKPTGGSGKSEPWMTIKLSQVFVSHIEQSVSEGDESLNEVVHLAYGAMNMTIQDVSTQGMTTAAPPVSWSQVTNQPTDLIT